MLPLKDENPTRRSPVFTWAILVSCVVVFIFAQQQPSRDAVGNLEFNLRWAAVPCELTSGEPLSEAEIETTFSNFGGDTEACGAGPDRSPLLFPEKSVWMAVVGSMFFHGGLLHLAGNMLYLWIFGNNVEDHLGHGRYLLFYLAGGVAATVAHVVVQPDSTIPVVGASGAIAALMGAYLVWFPDAPVRTLVFFGWFIFVRDIAAKWLLGFWLLLQFFTVPGSGVAWVAHVGGFAFGALVGLVIRVSSSARRAAWTPDHLGEMERGWDSTGGVGRRPYDDRQFGGRRY